MGLTGHHTGTMAAGATAQETVKPQVIHGGPRGDRTHNPRIKSPLLCQLS